MRTGPGWRDRRGMHPDTASAPGGRQPTRILIIDDHEISRAALRALLRTEGIDVADVGTGDAAIRTAIAFHPDVVIVDVTPADPAGFRITRRLRALPDAPPVVLTSSTSRRRFGSQLDPYPFVAKADLCARAIENATARPFPRLEEGHHAPNVQGAVHRHRRR
jgi:CheY-like chemotaxis protein